MIDQAVLGRVVHVQAQRQPSALAPDRGQGIERHLPVGAAAEADGVGKLAAAADEAAPAGVVTPLPARCVERQREEERHGAVPARGVGHAAFDGNMVPARAEVGFQRSGRVPCRRRW